MTFILENFYLLILPPPPWIQNCSDHPWARILVFLAIWWFFYFVLCHVTKRNPEYCCRCITLVHGLLTTCFTMTDIIMNEQNLDLICNTPLTGFQFYFLSVTLSYFLYDLLWINFFGAEPLTIYLHHICSILLLFKVLTSNTGGPGVSYGLFGLECTNPYLQTRWFLRTHGYQSKRIHKAVELWFMFTFIVIRVIGGTLLLYYVEIHPNMDITLKIAFIGIYVVSWLLVIQILQFFKRKYIEESPLLSGSVLSLFPYRRRMRNQTYNTPSEEN